MSVIYITNHDEVIYDVIKPPELLHKKSPRYKSYLKTKFKFENYENKRAYATMGPERVPLPNPSDFLRKHSKKLVRKENVETSGRYCTKQKKRPPVPSFKEMIQAEKNIKEKPKKNFIRKNVINISKKKVPESEAKFVDRRMGDVQYVEKSGLEPCYVFKRTYGKAPNYLLSRINKAVMQAQSEKDKVEASAFSNCHYITRQERQELLNGLKHNWDEMQKQYQLLPIITDTIPKIIRKTKLEKDLMQLEKDINLIERHPYIYIYNKD